MFLCYLPSEIKPCCIKDASHFRSFSYLQEVIKRLKTPTAAFIREHLAALTAVCVLLRNCMGCCRAYGVFAFSLAHSQLCPLHLAIHSQLCSMDFAIFCVKGKMKYLILP